jgi:hypothetical protein
LLCVVVAAAAPFRFNRAIFPELTQKGKLMTFMPMRGLL